MIYARSALAAVLCAGAAYLIKHDREGWAGIFLIGALSVWT